DYVQRPPVGEHPAEEDESFLGEALHERCVLLPAVLLAHLPAPVPERAALAQDDESGHAAGAMLLFRWKKFSGSYFALICASFSSLAPNASSTTPSPSSAKLMYVVPVPNSEILLHMSRTQETTLSSSAASCQVPSTLSRYLAERSLKAAS